jgi:hypothetical protein
MIATLKLIINRYVEAAITHVLHVLTINKLAVSIAQVWITESQFQLEEIVFALTTFMIQGAIGYACLAITAV